jgi:hypothetical protein
MNAPLSAVANLTAEATPSCKNGKDQTTDHPEPTLIHARLAAYPVQQMRRIFSSKET